MWIYNDHREKEFKAGKHKWDLAKQAAENCPNFKMDDEDELVSEEFTSCYNCRYRRWKVESFTCMKP